MWWCFRILLHHLTAKGRIAALNFILECSLTFSQLRFLSKIYLALHPLIGFWRSKIEVA